MTPPLISVIVPVRNNAEGVTQVLAALDRQTLAAELFEVIVADDGSRPEQVPPHLGREGRIRLVRCPPKTSYAARNAGLDEARGSILAFCDSDCHPDPRWLEDGLAALANADLVAGQVVFVAPPARPIWSLLHIDLFLDQERDVRHSAAVTANLLVRRDVFERLQGFDESLSSSGDYDFTHRAVSAGARLVYAESAIIRHPTMDSAREVFRKIWFTSYWAGTRLARRPGQQTPRLAREWLFVPILGVALARQSLGRPPFGLDRRRLAVSGITATWWDNVRGAFLVHTAIPLVMGLGRFFGWRNGRRMARQGSGPVYRTKTVRDAWRTQNG